ncbi:MAG: thioredoxin family protein [Alphaproteobacteria bacterium]|nr:thioredoxin family protein [Alphaproteobacteria bacterium]
MKKCFALFLALFCLNFTNNVWAVSQSVSTDKVAVKLITDKNCVKPDEDLQVLVKLQMKEEWHTYWKNPGDTGEATKIKWKLPAAYSDELKEISSPSIYVTEGIYQYGYEDIAYFLINLKNNATFDEKKDTFPEEFLFETEISWIACGNECVNEKVDLSFTINVNLLDHLYTNEWKKEFQLAEKTFPKKNTWQSFYEVVEDKLLLNINTGEKLSDIQKIAFIPHQENLINNAGQQIFGQESNLISLALELDELDVSNLSGVLMINHQAYDLSPLPQSDLKTFAPQENFYNHEEVSNSEESIQPEQGFLSILAFAFLGGLILNLMPCIFPILTLKAMSLVKGPQNKRENRIEALMYFCGVVACFLSIATVLVVLRTMGEKIGWGFQLQSPLFVIVMIIIFFMLFLMMIDVISIRNPFAHVGRISCKEQRLNAFITGLFSVLIATPCTAPFMGAAIGYTLTKPLYIYYPVFLALSVGYALPFSLLGFFPHLVHKLLPKSGKWMITLKKILSIPILLTCVWLVWVLYNQINQPTQFPETEIQSKENLSWQAYDEAKVEALLAEGKPVFIDFTAKWCITCLANKKLALDTTFFANLVEEKEINIFRADWTNKAPHIESALKTYGRNSIPLYIYYPQGSKQYKILPQMLTPNILKKYIEN